MIGAVAAHAKPICRCHVGEHPHPEYEVLAGETGIRLTAIEVGGKPVALGPSPTDVGVYCVCVPPLRIPIRVSAEDKDVYVCQGVQKFPSARLMGRDMGVRAEGPDYWKFVGLALTGPDTPYGVPHPVWTAAWELTGKERLGEYFISRLSGRNDG